MASEETDETRDRDVLFRRYFDGKQEAFLRTLVSDAVVEEHKQSPLGQHSEPLERLLLHFRRMPMAEQYVIKREGASSTFRLLALSGVRGVPPSPVGDERYTSVEEAYHGIFLRQIQTLMESE